MAKKKKKRSRKAKKDAEFFMQHLKLLGRTGASLRESAEALGMNDKELKNLFKKSPKVQQAWRQARLNLVLHVRTALAKSAGEGKFAAIQKLLEGLIQEVDRESAPAVDFTRLRTSELSVAIGRPRITIDRWRKSGLRRSADKTYSLPDFVDWFEAFCKTKYSGSSDIGGDRLRDVKSREVELRISEHRGELLDRKEAICGLIAWVQNIKSFCERSVEEHSRLCSNLPREKIVEVDKRFFGDLYVAAAKSPKELSLPPAMEKELVSFLARLGSHEYK